MTFRLSSNALKVAVAHLEAFGDTDVFPHLPELEFLRSCRDEIIIELAKLDLDSYQPGTAVEVLAPKGRLGFRIVHQLGFVDSILFIASVAEIGQRIEDVRFPIDMPQAFSYRFSPLETGEIFSADRTFRSWLEYQEGFIRGSPEITRIIETDISDFYSRVNFHRMDNMLDEVASGNGAVRFIKKMIKTVRARQSFGLPVGGAAARLLAELALNDTDKALESNAILSSRYVDDFRLFLTKGDDPYDALAFLAQHLSIREGLSLNQSKTVVFDREGYLEKLQLQLQDIGEAAEDQAFEGLVSNIYADGPPNEADLERLKHLNLMDFLQEELNKEPLDIGRIKLIFRALRISKPFDAVDFVIARLDELAIFSREVAILMHVLQLEHTNCFDSAADKIVDLILSPPASSIELVRAWLVDLFVRGTVPITGRQCRALEAALRSPLHRRQLSLIRGRLADRSHFGVQKTAFSTFSDYEKTCFIWGASCLPRDEFSTWLGTIKPNMTGPTNELFLKWAEKNQGALMDYLRYHPMQQGE